ncbi:MAG: phospho-N-acetylmuramoyl-pentapeptide-transferase [Turicibacter sp.]|nr:phospho-N-acetylmuramoyl-pentapeptide-transferase [Turicibacter sp.]
MSNEIIFQIVVSFFIAAVIAPIFIPFLHRLKFGQSIRKEGPQSHMKKAGTPTMGGIIFISSVLLTAIIGFAFTDYLIFGSDLIILFLTLFGFAIIGFVDDFIIVVRKNNEGLRPKQKFLSQIVLATIFFFIFLSNGHSTELRFFGLHFDLYFGYGLLILLMLVGGSNAVNLTDGVDGLAGGTSVIAFTTFGMIALAQHQFQVALFCFMMVGALLGFLVFNLNPAKVFMGDTGSLALGAALAAVSILLKQEILLVLVGLVFVLETLSVMLQVTYFKRTGGKRIFKMAPLHHHFELSGWSEWKVVLVFWGIGLATGVLSLMIAL